LILFLNAFEIGISTKRSPMIYRTVSVLFKI
jgi:hypothetical protein